MPLQKVHPVRLYDEQLQQMLTATAKMLAQSHVRLREAGDALIRANRDNDRQRKQLAEFYRGISLLRNFGPPLLG